MGFRKWKRNSHGEEETAERDGKDPEEKEKEKEEQSVGYSRIMSKPLQSDGGTICDDAEAFGDMLKNKFPLTWRAGLQNINLLPTSARRCKSRQLVNHIRETGFDAHFLNAVSYTHLTLPTICSV